MTAEDREIEFGEVEATSHERRLRPDRNRQFCVVACGRPGGDDLPIFIDLDALGDIEAHALSNTRVELGGVLLGGQYEDDQGRPFVLIVDTLRARHYESTARSLKFTHETWAEFTRQRAARPADLQIVGWYHTHPNMGIFLSEMDHFICEHFFGRSGDVALVVDPCQGQRGFFHWAGEVPDRTTRTGGFYVFASRHREPELTSFAAYLEGKIMGASGPRSGGIPVAGMPYPVSPVPYVDPRNAWLGPVMLGMMFIQFLLLALLTWKTLTPEPIRQKDEAQAECQRQIASLQEQLGAATPPAAASTGDWIRQPKVWGLAGVGILVAGALVWAAWTAGRRRREAAADEVGPA